MRKEITYKAYDQLGNILQMTDALGTVATQNRYNLLGQPIYTHNVDSGRRFMLSNNAGQPYLLWDNRNHQVENRYDNKMRPTTTHLKTAAGEKIIDKKEYADIPAQNTRNQLYRVYDQAGMVQFDTYDFRGNPTTESRSIAVEHNAIIDHSETIPYESSSFIKTHSFDAMRRVVTEVLPDNTIQQFSYNKAGLLEKINVQMNGSGSYTEYISNINYNARGQRTEVYFGNNTKTKYEYDENNFRLTRLLTTRNSGTEILQDLNYTYDPVGNIVEIVDNAQQIHYFNNSVIEPKGKYWYDALYRLVKATGRENESIAAAPGQADLAATTGIPYNNGANHLKNYTQTFEYDKLGNIGSMKDQGQWTRNYHYDAINKNRLISHDDSNQTIEYTYDAHGNMLSMPGIPTMEWDYADQLHKAISGTSTAFYNYDVGGNRVRKVVEKQDGSKEVRIYIGNFEIYRKFDSNDDLVTERKTVFVTDGEKRIATIDTLTVDNKVAVGTLVDVIRYQYDNHLGSASLELDETAAKISYEEYHPFGTTSYRSGRTETEVSLKRYRYVGKERDEETGLYYYGARYYAGWIARFVSVDPLQHDYPYYTPYQYAGNKPITFFDLDGNESTDNHKNFVPINGQDIRPESPQDNTTIAKTRNKVPQGQMYKYPDGRVVNLRINDDQLKEYEPSVMMQIEEWTQSGTPLEKGLKLVPRMIYSTIDEALVAITSPKLVQDILGIEDAVNLNGTPTTPKEKLEKGFGGLVGFAGPLIGLRKQIFEIAPNYSVFANGNNWTKKVSRETKEELRKQLTQSGIENTKSKNQNSIFGYVISTLKPIDSTFTETTIPVKEELKLEKKKTQQRIERESNREQFKQKRPVPHF